MEYETGVFVALVLICLNYLFLILRSKSLYEKNLNRIGMRSSWISGIPREIGSAGVLYKLFKFIFMIASSAVSVFLSWLTVIWIVGIYIYRLWKDFDPPERIKNLRWKMKNVHMSEEQILRTMFDTTELPESEFPVFLESHRNNYGEFYKN